ncbi:MAG TPA: hypothetical protein PKH02_03630 [Bacteroidales bacterium]|nr:hypothetical protein [Bacteroidales bacterium]HPT11827.1 hypothetical protein [Bacteroidales bacterium]
MKKNILLCSVLMIALLSSCCNEENVNMGLIVSNLEIPDFDQNYDGGCYNIPDTLCIKDDDTYRKTFARISYTSDCNTLTLPPVDFSEYSILIYKRFVMANARFHRNVIINIPNKMVVYTITTRNCFCADVCESFSYNIVLIPKVGDGYKVIYK